ncbi:transducin/WD40 repeat-like superfamily protein [Striga asiatica]|uniref:Cleavage stimulation factor 50 kDa subunit n=1 Tax=Striga asiatica TaxID=4170 RepID=A0A5A7QDB4_STRAF|nr:transducin/WD40 repeat-like superfamily protein [Striga asiatica]
MDSGGTNANGLEQSLQDGKLYRHVNGLIVAHLRDNNFNQAASAVASATMTPLNFEAPPNKLLELVGKVCSIWVLSSQQGLAMEKDEMLRGVSSTTLFDSGIPTGYGSIPAPRVVSVDFRWVKQSIFPYIHDVKGASKSFPKHESRHISDHKIVARCARFSPDGRFLATGSADTSIKLFEMSKVKQMVLSDGRDGPVRPVIRTFYDHLQKVKGFTGCFLNGRFFDFSKTVARKAFKIIQDTHNVRSVSFHPSGEFLLAGTDHPIAHLYDVNTFQCYLSANIQEINNGAINQVRYSSTGGMYVTASKDGAIRLWDGVTSQCVCSILGAHGTAEATSANFMKDQSLKASYLVQFNGTFFPYCKSLECWDRKISQAISWRHTHTVAVPVGFQLQAVFNETGEFVLSFDESSNEIVVWDALTAEQVARWPSNHMGGPRWIEQSPAEAAFVTCGADRSVSERVFAAHHRERRKESRVFVLEKMNR